MNLHSTIVPWILHKHNWSELTRWKLEKYQKAMCTSFPQKKNNLDNIIDYKLPRALEKIKAFVWQLTSQEQSLFKEQMPMPMEKYFTYQPELYSTISSRDE